MRALLLAAGLGTRLKPITDTIPKCLVPIHGRPLLDYWLDLLGQADVAEILINTHYFAERVDAHIEASTWRDRVRLVYEPELLGTGGTIAANRGLFRNEAFLVAHADNLTDLDVNAFVRAHQARPPGCAMSMLAFHTDDPRSCGILELDGRNIVQAFHEKVENPPGDLANAAVYLIEPEVADFCVSRGKPFVDLSTEVIPSFVGRIQAVIHTGYHRDIGNPQSLARAEAEFPARAPD